MNNKSAALQYSGWNVVDVDDEPKDHNLRLIARPNNGTYYITCMIDFPVLLDIPAFDSKNVSLLITGYDHYVQIPLSKVEGDFQEFTTILFYAQRTEGYNGQEIEGA